MLKEEDKQELDKLQKRMAQTISQASIDRIYDTGAKRDSNNNKPFIHNLTGYTRQRFGYHMNLGSKKYGDKNWTLGMPTDQYLESIDRHLAAYMEGDRSEDHLSAIIFGINGIMQNEKSENMPSNYYFNKLTNDK